MPIARQPGVLKAYARSLFVRAGLLAALLTGGLGAGAAGTAAKPIPQKNSASDVQYTSRIWQSDEGLPNSLVQAIAQTPDGYLWVGTHEGLARFDGMQFVTFEPTNAPEIKNSPISALCVDAEGTLWIGVGTDTGGLVRLRDGVFTRYQKPDGLAGDFVRALCPAADKSLWIGTSTGLSHFRQGKFTNYSVRQGMASAIISSVCEDADGRVWVATAGGLNRISKAGAVETVAGPNGPARSPLRGIGRDHQGAIWIGSNNGVIRHQDGKFSWFTTRAGLSHSFVRATYADRQGNLWVGTDAGLDRYCGGGIFVNELHDEGSHYDQINAIFEDQEENLWLASKEGLIRLTPRRFIAYTTKQGLSYNNIMSVRQDREGALWVGTWGGGLNRLKDGKVTVYGPTNGPMHDMILSTCESRDGSIWAGADFDGGLTRLKDGKTMNYPSRESELAGAVKVIHEDRAGNLWVGCGRGLSCLRNGKFTHYGTSNNLAGDSVRAICEDHDGNLWFGTDGGLSRWQDGRFINLTFRDGLSSNSIVSLYEDSRHDLWIGTQGGGLNRLRAGKFTSYTMKQGLFNDDVFEILEDDSENLWLSCLKGIFRVNKRDLADLDQGKRKSISSISYGRDDGLTSIQCNGVAKPAGWKARDGRLLFPTTKGLVAVDPNINASELPPPVRVDQVFADRQPVDLEVRKPANSRTAWEAVVHIPPGLGELEFNYTAVSFQSPEKDRFKYKLEGVDTEWIDADTRRAAHYYNVYPGNYRFRVIACNDEGVWNDEGATLAVVLHAHVWQTWWFRGLALLAAIGVVSGTARHMTKERMQRQLKSLAQEHAIEKERSRIAQDMHDEVGARLTEIMLVSHRARENMNDPEKAGASLEKISSMARAVVDGLDMLVWTVNPNNDSLDKLAVYICEYVQTFLEASAIQCRFDVPGELPHAPVSSEVRHNVLLAVKEALNNAVKHSRGTEVSVRLQLAPGAFHIWVEDNGRGFDRNATSSRGNGLQNMEKRMRNIGGAFELTTRAGQGSCIHLQFPVKNA